MKRLTILVAIVFYCMNASAQAPVDSTVKAKKTNDTLRIGNIIIIKKGGKIFKGNDSSKAVINTAPRKRSLITTNWGGVDIGFSNYSDKTNYAAATADGFLQNNRPGFPDISKDDFKLKTGKSININIWIVTQQLNIVKDNISLRYGFGLELNNYRYKSAISYKESGTIPYTNGTITNKPFVFRDSIAFSKNKLAADYLTVPLMLNFSTNRLRNNKRGFNVAFGVSAGYLYSQRNKQKSDIRGKEKNRGDYDLEKFKLSYVGEIGFGPVKFYASYAPKSIYEHSLDMRPYNFGFRLNAL
ncbi:MAG: outer membrane beta-barrel protein [Ferruginibacter sp.]